MFKIGNIKIKHNIVLAPMAGITNSSFRTICKDMGVGLVVSEMISDKAIVHQSKKTLEMLYMQKKERPFSVQLFGSEVSSLTKAAKYICENVKPDIIDINMGCPVPKVAEKSKAGSALLKDLNKISEIVQAVVKVVNIPVTVKIRSGWDSNNAVEIAKIIEKAGASAITIHPRTRKQGYSGKADWSIIKAVKENVNIPVIGNGDIKTCYDAKKMLDETGCDAVMIGRGTLGNPWLIKEIIAYLTKGIVLKEPTIKEKIKVIKRHISLLEKQKGEKLMLLEMRSHIPWYLKGIKNSKELKVEACHAKSKKELYDLLERVIKNEC